MFTSRPRMLAPNIVSLKSLDEQSMQNRMIGEALREVLCAGPLSSFRSRTREIAQYSAGGRSVTRAVGQLQRQAQQLIEARGDAA